MGNMFMDAMLEGQWSGMIGNVGMAGVLGIFMVLYLLIMFIAGAVSITSYILNSVGLYTLAKKRGIHHGWLAWIPVGSLWLLGSVSDQYQYVVKGKVKNRRKVLLWLCVLVAVAYAAIVTFAVAIGVNGAQTNMQNAEVGLVIGLVICCVALIVLAICLTVFQYLAYYDLFASCQPNNAVLFLVLSIVFSVTLPVLVFVCRKKDLGMPPRKPASVPKETVLVDAEPAEEENTAEEQEETVLEEGFAKPEEFEDEQ